MQGIDDNETGKILMDDSTPENYPEKPIFCFGQKLLIVSMFVIAFLIGVLWPW